MQEFFQILTNFGFPIALSCYLLLRFEKILENLSKTISDLVLVNTNLINEVKTLAKNNGKSISELKKCLGRKSK